MWVICSANSQSKFDEMRFFKIIIRISVFLNLTTELRIRCLRVCAIWIADPLWTADEAFLLLSRRRQRHCGKRRWATKQQKWRWATTLPTTMLHVAERGRLRARTAKKEVWMLLSLDPCRGDATGLWITMDHCGDDKSLNGPYTENKKRYSRLRVRHWQLQWTYVELEIFLRFPLAYTLSRTKYERTCKHEESADIEGRATTYPCPLSLL